MACSTTIQDIYSSGVQVYVMYLIMALTLALFAFGLYNIAVVFKTRGKFANELLMLFYVFAELTLLMRFALYLYVIVANDESAPCKQRWLAITLQDLPDYLYLMSGMC